MIGGLINGSTEVDNPESKIIYLLNGNKNISVQKIIIVELIDCVLQVILSFLIIVLFLLFKGEIKGIDLIVLISYILSTTLCSSIAYYLTLFSKLNGSTSYFIDIPNTSFAIY